MLLCCHLGYKSFCGALPLLSVPGMWLDSVFVPDLFVSMARPSTCAVRSRGEFAASHFADDRVSSQTSEADAGAAFCC